MKWIKVMGRNLLLLLLLAGVNWSADGQQGDTTPVHVEWPRVFIRGGETNTVYQPQLESWDGKKVQARSAVSIQPVGAQQPVFGTIKISANAYIDKVERIVYLDHFQITEAKFPSQPQRAAAYLETFRSYLPTEIKTISLDRVEASLAILEQKRRGRAQPLRNDPPQIVFSSKPAMLIQVDGDPIYRPVEGTDLERLFNTRTLLLRDKTGKLYLHLFDGYLETPNTKTPWSVAKQVPESVKIAEKQAVAAKQVDLLAGQENPKTKAKPSLKTNAVPDIYLVTTPTELIVTRGEPQWVPIPSTQLLFATNTASHVFRNIADQKTYVLISGRWFRADSTSGPWQFVSGENLPKDFATIPDDSLKENVKASVPNTRQSQEAMIANDIPQTTKVDRRTTKMDPPPTYEGGIQLQPIEGSTMMYAANSATPVIKINSRTWYACQDGVWFIAESENGPWTVAESLPPKVYSIPANSPLHYVTYVRIYNSDPQYVWIGVTSGYYGTVVAQDGVVVYGTGYTYPAYVSTTEYISYPITYGYASNPTWTPWAGWAFGFAAGWALADDWDDWKDWGYYCPAAPYWGAYRYGCYGRYYNAYGGINAWGPYGWAGTSGYVYHQSGSRVGVSRGAAGFNAWTGNQWASQYGRSYNSATGVRTAGARTTVNNVYTGRYADVGRGAAVHEPSGATVAGRGGTVGGPGGEVTGGRGVAYNPQTGQGAAFRGVQGDEGGVARVNNHVVAARDGNVYHGNANSGWNNVSATPHARSSSYSGYSSTAARPQTTQSFNREAAARTQGAQRQASFQSHQPSFSGRPAGGSYGGGRAGGGGGRRR
jgi:hypothetical protein